jgi:hypothetical protein
MTDDPWYSTYFDERFLALYEALLPPAEARLVQDQAAFSASVR